MASLSFDKLNKIITVDSPDTEITIQELIDKIRDWEDEQEQLSIYKVANATGKEELGGGVKVGITLTLIDWKITFEARLGPTWTLCNINGGNLVRYDTDTLTYGNPIEPSAYTTITLTSSSSATLQELEQLQYSSFQNAVWVDVTSSNYGTDFPNGSRAYPVNNIPDAVIIATEKGFDTIQIIGNITLGAGHNVEHLKIIGQSCIQTSITILPDAETESTQFECAIVSGVLDGNSVIKECQVYDIEYIYGIIRDSILIGTIVLDGFNTAHICNCSSDSADSVPIIDMGGSGQALSIRGYRGRLQIHNKTGNETVSIDMDSGEIILDTTVVNGTLICRGVGKLTDNSSGNAVVINEMLHPDYITADIWSAQLSQYAASGNAAELLRFAYDVEGGSWEIDTGTKQMIFYKSDNITEIARFDLFDENGSPASDDVYERKRV